jgi:hypothetical protein
MESATSNEIFGDLLFGQNMCSAGNNLQNNIERRFFNYFNPWYLSISGNAMYHVISAMSGQRSETVAMYTTLATTSFLFIF